MSKPVFGTVRNATKATVASGPRWNLHDIYLVRRIGHDRLWIGTFGIGPDGEFIGTRLMPDTYIRKVMRFYGWDDLDTRMEMLYVTIRDIETWDAARWERWHGSFASVYSDMEFGQGRYTIEGATPEDRIKALDRSFGFMRRGAKGGAR